MGQTQSGPGRLAPSSNIKRAGEDKKRAKSHDVLSSQKAVDDVVSVQDGGSGPSQTEMENKLLPKRRETLSPNHFHSSISGSGGGQYHSQILQARRYSNTPSISSTRTTDSGHYPSAISSGNATHASQQQQQNQNRPVSLNLVGPSAGGQSLFNSNPISKSNQALHPSRTEFSSGTPKSPLTPQAIRPVPLPASYSTPSNKNYTHEAEEFRPTKFDKDKFKKANNNAASIDPSQTLPRMLSHSSRVKLDQNDEDLMNAILQETL